MKIAMMVLCQNDRFSFKTVSIFFRLQKFKTNL